MSASKKSRTLTDADVEAIAGRVVELLDGGRRVLQPRDQLTPRDVAARCGFSYHAILRAINRGDLKASEPVRGRLLIDVEEYERWRKTPRRDAEPRPEPPQRRRRARREAGFRAELTAIENGDE